METVRTFILLTLLLTVHAYPQDVSVWGIGETTTGTPVTSLKPEGLTAASVKEAINDEATRSELLSTNLTRQGIELESESKQIDPADNSAVSNLPQEELELLALEKSSEPTAVESFPADDITLCPLELSTVGSSSSLYDCVIDAIISGSEESTIPLKDNNSIPLTASRETEKGVSSVILEGNSEELDLERVLDSAQTLSPTGEADLTKKTVPEVGETTAVVSDIATETQDVTILSEVNQRSKTTKSFETDGGFELTTSTDAVPASETPTDPKTTNIIIEISPRPPNFCVKTGNFSHSTNCRIYISCSGNATNLSGEKRECPERYAFSPIVQRCTRDLSPCGDDEPICSKAGSIPGPSGSSSYFWCIPSLLGGFHKYKIQCASDEAFHTLIGRCMPEVSPFVLKEPTNGVPSDRDVVRAEWKQLKKAVKIKAKEEKIRRKMEAKAVKLAAKNDDD